MKKSEFSKLQVLMTESPTIKASDYEVGTLAYGYDTDKNTVHIYVDEYDLRKVDDENEHPLITKEKFICILVTKLDSFVSFEKARQMEAHKLVPSKRCYADRTSFAFAKEMHKLGFRLAFTGINDLTETVPYSVFFGFTENTGDYYISNYREPKLEQIFSEWVEENLLTYEVVETIDPLPFESSSFEAIKNHHGYHSSVIGHLENAIYPYVILDSESCLVHHKTKAPKVANYHASLQERKEMVEKRIDELCNNLGNIHEDLVSYEPKIRKMAIIAFDHMNRQFN